MATEAREAYKKATNIKIPNNDDDKLVAEYFIHETTGKFSHFRVIPSSTPPHEGSSPTFRKKVIDISVPGQIAGYDKSGYKQLLSSLKYYVFGNDSVCMTKKKCEDFFDTSSNFA